MALRSVTRRAAAIRSGGNFIASLFEGGQLGVIGIFAAALRARHNIRQRRRRNQIRRAVRQLLSQLAREVQRAILQRLTDEYIQTAREIETFSEGLQAASEALKTEAADAASEVLNDMSVTFEAQLRYMRRDADDLYRQIIEAEAENREAASATLNSAVQNAIRRFAENGVTGFTDAAGRNWGLYEYTNMAMRTAIQRAGLKATLKTMARIGHDLCFVQRHAGACPICEAWYGKILSASGLSAEYPSVQEAMEAGLFHPNCCDVLQVYIPGVSNLDAGMGGFSQEASAARYAASQRQRALERDIRRWKRIQAASIAPEDERAAKAHVDLLQRRLRALTGEYDLPRRYDREGGRVPLSDATKAIKPAAVQRSSRASNAYGAMSATRNTGKQVYFNPQASYTVKLDSYSDMVNAGISKAAREVAFKGSASRTEHMYLVNLSTGNLDFYETNDEPSSVGYAFREYLSNHSSERYAFVHNHNTDGSFSEADVRTLLTDRQTPVMIAVRNDGIIYAAERSGNPLSTGFFDPLYADEIGGLNKKLRDGIITASQRTHMREQLLVDNLLRDYTKKGMVEYGATKQQ